ncbi:phage tail tube protein [Clostridium sp. AWRP]|uniref:phage tail tube protein n=1 Tax=Clostridium sp. AWRP TaxID=2212991 RepID=UPI001585EA85|nr:phage tail tube protein [Clostridium sp. AWRP]
MANKGTDYLVGTNMTVYMNNVKITEIASCELKVTGKFDDVNQAGEFGTTYVYLGYECSGTLKLNKMRSVGASIVGEAYLTGEMPQLKVSGAVTNKVTKQTGRMEFYDVVVTEFGLNSEVKKLITEEIPIKAGSFKVLDKINPITV